MNPRRPRNRLTARAALGIARELSVRDRAEQRVRERFMAFLRREGLTESELESALEPVPDEEETRPPRRFRESFGLVVSGLTAASLLFALTLGCTSAPPAPTASLEVSSPPSAYPRTTALCPNVGPEWCEPLP